MLPIVSSGERQGEETQEVIPIATESSVDPVREF
jgi:hypothetical protein